MSLRIETLASFVHVNDKVVDVGCDHAYLAIFLAYNKACKKVVATEINPFAYEIALKNIKKVHLEKDIKLTLTDGLKDLEVDEVDTAVIAGMGTHTILQILKEAKNKGLKKLIIQSNNDLYLLRSRLKKRDYYLTQEKIIKEKDIWYTIDVFTLNKQKQTNLLNYWGIKDCLNKKYYQDMYTNLKKLNQKISYKNLKRKLEIYYQLYLLKKYL